VPGVFPSGVVVKNGRLSLFVIEYSECACDLLEKAGEIARRRSNKLYFI